MLYKFAYLAVIIISILFYLLLKKKMNSINCKKSVEYSYRYIYIAILVLLTRFIAVILYKDGSVAEAIKPSISEGIESYLIYYLSKLTLKPLYSVIIVNTILTFACAVVIKRLVFNTTNYVLYNFNAFFVILGIYILLKIIDEVKQHKLKNNKYLKLTCVMGLVILLDILTFGRFEFWILVLLSSLVISNNVGYVRLNSKREFVEKFSNLNTRKFMYKMEVITVNKLILVSVILLAFMGLGVLILFMLGINVFDIYSTIDINVLYKNISVAISSSRNYYSILLLFIIILDILGIILKRKKDTKTTLLKLCTILITFITAMLDIFLIVSLILNVGNIYYNREEKIKLLKSEN